MFAGASTESPLAKTVAGDARDAQRQGTKTPRGINTSITSRLRASTAFGTGPGFLARSGHKAVTAKRITVILSAAQDLGRAAMQRRFFAQNDIMEGVAETPCHTHHPRQIGRHGSPGDKNRLPNG